MFEPKCPLLAVDVVMVYAHAPEGPSIVAIERKYPPLGLALPGGFVDIGETVEAAAKREMKEELNVDLQGLGLIGVFSDPKRDPRRHVVSVAFLGTSLMDQLPEAGDDAKSWKFVPIENFEQEEWCFDHRSILRRAGLHKLYRSTEWDQSV